MTNVLVTGGSGKAGRAVVAALVAKGYGVLNVDLMPPREDLSPFLRADLTDMGQVIDCMSVGAGVDDMGMRKPIGKVDAVVHMAAIRAPGLVTEDVTFKTNMLSTFNVFSAATRLGLKKVVWASSETLFGLPLRRVAPAYAPLDEEHPLLPESSYALSKDLCEEMARQMHRWNPGTAFLGLRISNVKEPSEYGAFKSWQSDAHIRKWNLWSYVDARDVAGACVNALECGFTGADHFNIASNDTVMERPSRELMAEIFPRVPFKREIGKFETLQSNQKATAVLGYQPRYSWRTQS